MIEALWRKIRGEDLADRMELAFPGDWPRVPNPFGLALGDGVDLNQALSQDPESGEALLASYVKRCAELLDAVAEQGGEAATYTLFGASSRYCTPMQYGGLYLERDREILLARPKSIFTLIFVVGDEETYLDFVSDLPAEAFGWDPESTGFSVSQVRALRSGLLAAADAEADLFLLNPAGTSGFSSLLTQEVLPTHVA